MREPCNFIKKEALAQVFSCEFYEIPRNNYRTLLVAVSGYNMSECVMLIASTKIPPGKGCDFSWP